MSAFIRRALMPSLLVLGLALVGSPALAQTGQVKGKVVDAKNQPVEKADVIIEATDGMVLLSGAVDSDDALRKAVAAARAVPGVREVDNRLVPTPRPRPAQD